MELRDYEKNGSFTLEDAYARVEAGAEVAKRAGTFMHDGRILCCAGYSIIHPGVAEGWIIPSIYVGNTPKTFCRIIKSYIDQAMEDEGLHRFQTTSYHDDFHKRWMEWLGFEREAIMKKFTHQKKDHCLYARVR